MRYTRCHMRYAQYMSCCGAGGRIRLNRMMVNALCAYAHHAGMRVYRERACNSHCLPPYTHKPGGLEGK